MNIHFCNPLSFPIAARAGCTLFILGLTSAALVAQDKSATPTVIGESYFSRDGSKVAVPATDAGTEFELFDTATAKKLGHFNARRPAEMSTNGLKGLSGDWMLDLKNPKKMVLLQSKDELVLRMLAPNGRAVATSNKQNAVIIWDAETGKSKTTLLKGDGPNVVALGFSADSKLLAVAGSNRSIRIVGTTGGAAPAAQPGNVVARGLRFSPDGKLLAAWDHVGKIDIWDVAEKKLTVNLKVNPPQAGSVDFLPNGKAVVWTAPHFDTSIMDIATGKELFTSKGHYYPAFSSTGESMALVEKLVLKVPSPAGLGTVHSAIKVIDTGTWKERAKVDLEAPKAVLQGDATSSLGVTFSADGMSLIVLVGRSFFTPNGMVTRYSLETRKAP